MEKKRQLIEINQQVLITCDNPKCDFEIENPTGDANAEIIHFINVACPKCGENLLTVEDYLQSRKMLKIVNWLNKWFSWIMWFYPKNVKKSTVSVHYHDKATTIRNED